MSVLVPSLRTLEVTMGSGDNCKYLQCTNMVGDLCRTDAFIFFCIFTLCCAGTKR